MTGEKKQTLCEITSEVEAYFNELSYHKVRIRVYQNGWKRLKQFMEEQRTEIFDAKVGDAFITNILNKRSYTELSRKEKDLIRSTNVLIEYQTTGMIKFRSVRKDYNFEGEIGNLMQNFLSYRKAQGMSKDTIASNKLYLHRFLSYLNSNKILSLSGLDKQHILGFINVLGFSSKSTIHCTLSSIRGFLRYLFDNQYLDYDLTYLVPKSSYKKEARLPTTYTKDEVERVLATVDTASPKGKRDKAMILLAARLGLRASDICGLKFENILWETNTIHLIQKKTKEKLELPLLVELGNAIIDYLKYGRPESDLPYIFLRAGQPYDKLEEPTLHSIVSFYLKHANISNIDHKKHGPHALRHSLAGILLEQKTPLPVISEVLGHTNTESTKTYLRIDLESLRECALDVPKIQSPHYQGGELK
ncbi:tyrosine-type recombinase/integrase [Salicibibacter cibi]|uniref:Tyrosine-type recombinase/integrase n=1 Tax=Salicibibacter cibi TaxID=2743001 RepID=A0A7T6ZAY5_9BACI|nr:site-specific integrase [Salicibibacter cibi]QQK79915.1 tyrosine-type recombinase/integrase [Salicibibacter cibi]